MGLDNIDLDLEPVCCKSRLSPLKVRLLFGLGLSRVIMLLPMKFETSSVPSYCNCNTFIASMYMLSSLCFIAV